MLRASPSVAARLGSIAALLLGGCDGEVGSDGGPFAASASATASAGGAAAWGRGGAAPTSGAGGATGAGGSTTGTAGPGGTGAGSAGGAGGATTSCGDGACNGGEACATCPGDCGACPPACPDGACNGDETWASCPADCPTVQPGGRPNYAVVIGRLKADAQKSWVRLAPYVFGLDGVVTAQQSQWTEDELADKVPANQLGGACALGAYTCPLYKKDPTSKSTLSGTYTHDASTVTIAWSSGGTETWTIASPQPFADLVMLTLKGTTGGTSFEANVGYAFGSHRDFADFTSAATIASTYDVDYVGRQKVLRVATSDLGVRSETVKPVGDADEPSGYALATLGNQYCPNTGGDVMSFLQPTSKLCSCKGSNDTSIVYSHFTPSRWNVINQYCRCLIKKDEYPCYADNMHTKWGYEVLGDGGQFHGWVAVEASWSGPDQVLAAYHWIK